MWPSSRADFQQWERITRAAIGPHAWGDEWTAGRALGIEAVVREVVHTASLGAAAVTPHASSRIQGLTPRELHAAHLAARGLSNRRIGEVLVIRGEKPLQIISRTRSTNWTWILEVSSPPVLSSWAADPARRTSESTSSAERSSTLGLRRARYGKPHHAALLHRGRS
jgi:hypothetical protein